MNQTTNLIQWKNLTEEQKAGFDFEGYDYKMQCDLKWFDIRDFEGDEVVYRLKIEPEKWYCLGMGQNEQITQGKYILSSSYHTDFQTTLLRPATAAEIPKPEVITLEDRVKFEYSDFDVVMLEWTNNHYISVDSLTFSLKDVFDIEHIAAQSMRNFAGYVYLAHPFSIKPSPVMIDSNGMVHPTAVLFTRAGE